MKESVVTAVQLLMTAVATIARAPRGTAERVLLARARRGDVAAFERLLHDHDEPMRRLAFRMLGSVTAMDDVLQEAYLRAFRGLDDFAGGSAFGTWLYRIVTNACLDELRRAGRRPAAPLEESPEPASSGVALADDAAQRLDLAAALAALEPGLRLVVLMVDAEGFSYDEVGLALGIPAGTVASRLNRARSALRPHLDPRTGGPAT